MSIIGLVMFIAAIVLYFVWYYVVAPRMLKRIEHRIMMEEYTKAQAELEYECHPSNR